MLRCDGPRGERRSAIQRLGGMTGWTVRRSIAAILIFLICGCGLFERDQSSPLGSQTIEGPRIVVLPFVNNGAPDDAFIAAGMGEEIGVRLAAVAGMAVISNSSTVGGGIDAAAGRQIGEDLGAEYALSGTLQLDREADGGPRLLVNPRLLRIGDGNVLWSSTYDHPFSDVFGVQADIVINVVDALGVEVLASERRLLELNTTANMEAYEAYLFGLPYRSSFELGELQTAESFFQRAVELDPGFSSAHVALSENHSLMFHFRYDRSPQRLANANAAAHRALELQPDLPEGHRALGYYYYWGQRNYQQALTEFSLAAAGRPNDPAIMSSIGIVLRRQGRWEEAMNALQRASKLDPMSDLAAVDLATTCGRMRRWVEGVDHCQRAIELAPNDIFPYVFLAKILWARDGSTAGAREILEAMPDKDPAQQGFYWYELAMYERDYPAAIEWLGSTEEMISDPINEEMFPRSLAECESRVFGGAESHTVQACSEARQHLERDRELTPVDPAVHAALGWTYALVGEPESAIASGERAVELLPVSADALAGHTFLVRLAKIYAWTDEPYLAVKTIEKALAMPGWLSIATIGMDPDWDPIRKDPRFRELLRIHDDKE